MAYWPDFNIILNYFPSFYHFFVKGDIIIKWVSYKRFLDDPQIYICSKSLINNKYTDPSHTVCSTASKKHCVI